MVGGGGKRWKKKSTPGREGGGKGGVSRSVRRYKGDPSKRAFFLRMTHIEEKKMTGPASVERKGEGREEADGGDCSRHVLIGRQGRAEERFGQRSSNEGEGGGRTIDQKSRVPLKKEA